VIAGPDQLGWREKLIGRAKQLGIGTRITWTGMISGASKWGAFRAAEVFILPSHQENFGVAAVEALSVGVPLLVSDKVNIWREIQADRAGIIAADNLQGTCESLQAFAEMSEEKKEAMRRRARICFEQRFEIKKAADSLRAVLGGITQSN
jgi:glycosyltransferase involved in cell wall biosynthesis